MKKNNKFKLLNKSLFLAFILFINTTNVLAEEKVKSDNQINTLAEKTKIPEIEPLRTWKGDYFDLNQAIKEKPTVLIFYRGGWCPYCNAQLSKLKSIENKLVELGFQIIAISPDKPDKLKESIDKHELTYLLLSDSKMKTAKAFGISFKVDDFTLVKYKTVGIDLKKASGEEHELLPIPSVFIIDKKGIINFKYSNPDYKTRLEPEIILNKAIYLIKSK